MDLARFQDDHYLELLRAFYRQKYANRRIDVLIAVMGPALDFLLLYGAELFPGAPIVFCGISGQEIEGRDLGPNITGVLMRRQFKETLALALSGLQASLSKRSPQLRSFSRLATCTRLGAWSWISSCRG